VVRVIEEVRLVIGQDGGSDRRQFHPAVTHDVAPFEEHPNGLRRCQSARNVRSL